MSKYEKVKAYYKSGLWDISRVKNAVKKSWLTKEQFEEIVGQPYGEASE